MRARADRATGSIFLTALEHIPLQGFAGRWLKVMWMYRDQGRDDLMVALGANTGAGGLEGQTGCRSKGENGSRGL